uniref:DUF8039 domain-containing protein n=1 Tax=Tanacetum cinerariifolium TaxID=118510 RepID=A0A699KG90_TANCI|nr:hypothetical protein [Tanacetum cinerariifolium]
MVWNKKIIAKGHVYQSRDGILHGLPIEPGFVKVQVDNVEEGCSAFPVARPTDKVSKKISSHKSMSHPSSNGPSRYQTASARVFHTPIDEPMPSQAPLTGHGHHQMVVLD